MKNLEDKIKLINKYYKKVTPILDITLIDYETYNIYIRLDYYRKINCTKLSWIDLDLIKDNNVEKYISSEYINTKQADYICSLFEKNNKSEYISKKNKHKVIINAYLNEYYHYELSRYIPKELSNLSEIFVLIFNNLPRKLDNFLYEIHAELMNTKSQYEYNDTFEFDLFKDDLEMLFNNKIIERGKKYYSNNKVKFLEKVEDKYYAIVEGTEKYLVVIKYDKKNKLTQVYCACPCKFYCKHIYSVILAIRNNKIKKFYKVIYKQNEENLLESVLNSKYFLSSGIDDDCIEIINRYGEIELVPLFDENNKLNWKVIEENDDKELSKKIEKLIK